MTEKKRWSNEHNGVSYRNNLIISFASRIERKESTRKVPGAFVRSVCFVSSLNMIVSRIECGGGCPLAD